MLPMILSVLFLAADLPPPSPIRLPDMFRLVGPAPAPTPMPGPTPPTIPRLTADTLYVIDWDVPGIVLTSPAGLVTVTEDAGPLRVRGVFADGNGKSETRNFAGKFVYTVEATHTGRVELIVVPVGAKTAAEVIRRTIDVVAGDAPRPPQPEPGPAPKPTPGPTTPVKVKAVAVYESQDAAVAADAFFGSKELAARWKDKGHRPPVVVDKDTKDPITGTTPAKLKPYVDRAAGKVLPQLYLIDTTTGDVLFEGPIPANPADLLNILIKIGG